MKLYDLTLSGHAHRARLMASLLNVELQLIPVDLLNGAHKQPEYLAKNPFGQVPTLEDGETTIYDSNAILVYLATKYDSTRTWYPEDPATAALIQNWLSRAANEVAHGPAKARLVEVFNAPFESEPLIAKSTELLNIMDAHLSEREWFVTQHPTIADVALYSYIAHAIEGGVNVPAFPNVTAWLNRVESLDGFLAMPKTDTLLKAQLVA
ncbi:MAG: glutathione S-transferase [Alteromonadaceae bacterium]|nr:glutathione S-transferase [Alteromonadaceae bacterium]